MKAAHEQDHERLTNLRNQDLHNHQNEEVRLLRQHHEIEDSWVADKKAMKLAALEAANLAQSILDRTIAAHNMAMAQLKK